MRTRLLIVTIALMVQGLAAQTERILIDHHRAIRLRDGVTVFADVYRPSAEGKYPTIVVRTPYGVDLTMLGRVAAHVAHEIRAYEIRGTAPALGVRRA